MNIDNSAETGDFEVLIYLPSYVGKIIFVFQISKR